MNAKPLEVLATELVEVNLALLPLVEKEKELKEEIRTYEGEKIIVDGGMVSVSRATSDREDGTVVVFKADRFNTLSPKLQAELLKAGVVQIEPKIVKGAAPRVTVKLAVAA